MELPASDGVLRGFFDNIHIFNPILEEEDVQNYINTVQFEGIGWDGMSCLVVTNIELPYLLSLIITTAWLTTSL